MNDRSHTRPNVPEQIELDFIKWIEGSTGCELRKLPAKYGADYISMNGDKPSSLIIAKVRDIGHDRFPMYGISFYKSKIAMSMASDMGLELYLWVYFDDGRIGRVRMDERLDGMIRVPNANADRPEVEPLIQFPTTNFQWLN